MPDQPNADSKLQVQAHLYLISQLLREAHRLGPDAQELLADLVDELGVVLDSDDVPAEEVAKLTECTSHLVQAVHEQHEPGVLAAAEERLENAVVAVETKAPGLAHLTRRLADLLANIGI